MVFIKLMKGKTRHRDCFKIHVGIIYIEEMLKERMIKNVVNNVDISSLRAL